MVRLCTRERSPMHCPSRPESAVRFADCTCFVVAVAVAVLILTRVVCKELQRELLSVNEWKIKWWMKFIPIICYKFIDRGKRKPNNTKKLPLKCRLLGLQEFCEHFISPAVKKVKLLLSGGIQGTLVRHQKTPEIICICAVMMTPSPTTTKIMYWNRRNSKEV